MEEIKVKNCPFCNGESSVIETKGFHGELIMAYVRCEKCGASSAAFSTIEGAIEAWNMRCSDNDTGKCIGKWIAFKQEGMPMVLHGKIIYDCKTYFVIKCKNGQKRFAGLEDIIGLYDSKSECYSIRN